MSWTLAFMQQLAFFLIGVVYFTAFYNAEQLNKMFPGINRRFAVGLLFLWLGVGTWFRCYATEIITLINFGQRYVGQHSFMSWVQAFGMQLIIFLVGVVCWMNRVSFTPEEESVNPFTNRPTAIFVMFLWFGIGTWYRHYTQMPLLGVWGYLFSPK